MAKQLDTYSPFPVGRGIGHYPKSVRDFQAMTTKRERLDFYLAVTDWWKARSLEISHKNGSNAEIYFGQISRNFEWMHDAYGENREDLRRLDFQLLQLIRLCWLFTGCQTSEPWNDDPELLWLCPDHGDQLREDLRIR